MARAAASAQGGLALAPDDLHHRVFAQPHVAGDQPIGQAVVMQLAHLRRLLVRWALAHLAPEYDATGPGSSEAGFDALADEITFELGQARP